MLLTGDADAVLKNPEMSALYFGGSIEQAKDGKNETLSRT